MFELPSISWLIVWIVWLHFVADFLLQSDKMAKNKSSSNQQLTIHVAAYSVPFLIFFGPVYAAVNFVLHWVTDYCSSRATKVIGAKLRALPPEQQNWHWFFAVIGLDQAIHMTSLILTIPLIGW